jgi:type IV secretory pathway TraG/TraD family ATPase VirD4
MQKVDCDFGDVIAAAATTLLDAGENERGSILSTARRQTAFLDSVSIQKCLEPGNLDLSELKQNPKGVTIYLVLPEWRIAKHARWLRLIITTLIHALERTERGDDPETGEAHHCYREKPNNEDLDDLKGEEKQEAEKENKAARLHLA